MSRVPKFFLPVESLSTSIIPKSTNATESSSRSSSFPTTIRSPSAFTDCPEEEESTIFLTEAERDIFNRIYFIDPEALTPFGPLDPTRDPSTGHYKWRERSRNTSLPAVHVRPNLTGADVTFRVKLNKLITIYAHVPMHSWEYGTCDSRSVRAALQKGYFSLLRGDPRSIIVRPAMYPIPAISVDERTATPSIPDNESYIISVGKMTKSHALPSPSVPALRQQEPPRNPDRVSNFSFAKLVTQIPTPSSGSKANPPPLPMSDSSVARLMNERPPRIDMIGVNAVLVKPESGITTPAHLLATVDSLGRESVETALGSSRMTSTYDLNSDSTLSTPYSSNREAAVSLVGYTLFQSVQAATLKPALAFLHTLRRIASKLIGYVSLHYLNAKLDDLFSILIQLFKGLNETSLPPWFWPLMLRYFCIILAYGFCLIITQPVPRQISLISVSCV